MYESTKSNMVQFGVQDFREGKKKRPRPIFMTAVSKSNGLAPRFACPLALFVITQQKGNGERKSMMLNKWSIYCDVH